MTTALRLSIRQLLAALVALTLASGAALAVDGSEMFADPTKEERAREIGRQLRCMVCQNQSIFDSNSGLAKDLRVLVRTRMEEGETDKEILSYIADRYGDYVLLNPRMSLKNAVLWLTPVMALLLSLGAAIGYMRSRRHPVEEVPLTEEERSSAQKILKDGRS
ncbi:cytochrome c-type biogenesis protein [Labrenzia sp. PHM005]|uniref:cytochrome c-type biogenesis protein n=1 Tax=Labrenzia sp. PHM005 TaxID=2590016 RepID=UPI001140871A|nr:cytochrome c-type biogenesis protein [Labrenzia sp. PHM005]QDG75986.1 cytochrome c-type biogenesis protein CcmH [Labrenzia sp. PHM005]